MNRRYALASLALLPVAGAVGLAHKEAKPVSLKDLPRPWHSKEDNSYRVDPYIAAAAAFQAEPKTAADTLKKLIKDADGDDKDQAFILCRMLFTAKPKGEFRPPLLGAPSFLGVMDDKGWPLDPIELVDGVPFLVVTGFFGGGDPESASQYLDYCLKECDWTTEKYKPKEKEAKEKALAKLQADKRWKRELTKEEKEYLGSQIK